MLRCRVYEDFRAIADTQGSQSQDKKISKIRSLIMASQDFEAQYIIRALQVRANLRR